MEKQKFGPRLIKKITKSLDDYLWNLTSNVVCTICHELFIDPVTTPCGHNFCSNCLKKLNSGGNSIKKNCPLCRHSLNRREIHSNKILERISILCSDLSHAFREDVMKLNPSLRDLSMDLVNTSRIVGVSSDKNKEKHNKNEKESSKVDSEISHIAQTPCIISLNDDETNSKNEECMDLKSVSQIELKSQLYVADSPEIEKKLRSVKRVPSKQKVSDWLNKVNGTSDPSCSYRNKKFENRDDSIIQGTANKDVGRSMIRVDYDKSKKMNDKVENVKIQESDPYEFIASQRTYEMKTRRKVSRGRKKSLPDFQAIQSFSKESLKRNCLNKTVDLFDDVCDENLQKTHKTYSRKSDRTITMGEKTQEKLLRDHGKIMSDSEDSVLSKSDFMPRARRRILPLYPDADSDNSLDINIKRVKLDSNSGISDHDSTGKKSEDEVSEKTKTLRTSKVPNKRLRSPGWTRISNIKMDFEMAEKNRKPCRKSLNISGGEPSLNSSKKSVTELSPEYGKEKLLVNEIFIDDLTPSSEQPVVVEAPSSAKKGKDIEVTVEETEKGADSETPNKDPKVAVTKRGAEENAKVSNAKEIIHKTPKSKIIPFALLGSIKKKKRSAILFVKLGRLSSNVARSRSTVVKLIFPKTIKKNIKKSGNITVETQTDIPASSKPSKRDIGVQTVGGEPERGEINKLSVAIQTSENFLQSNSIEVQTTQKAELKSVAVQTVMDNENSRIMEESNIPFRKSQGNCNDELFIDPELESQLNKVWFTQVEIDKDSLEKSVSKSSVKKESNKAIPDSPSSDADVLVQRAADNIDLDLARIRAVPPSTVKDQCEESDSDIFIEQTPPKNNSRNSSTQFKPTKISPDKSDANRIAEESFLLLSECQNQIPDYVKMAEPAQNVRTNDSQQQKRQMDPLSFAKENNENDQNEPNVKKRFKTLQDKITSERQIRIVSSGILNRENIDKFVKKFKVEYLSHPRKDMTHLIVGIHESEDDGLVPYCTQKLLYAMANKKWVVTEAWVETCLKLNAVVKEEPFESVDPIGGNGCSVARLSTDFLLKNCQIYLLGEYKNITKEEFSDLIADCGGTVVRQFSQFSFSPGNIRMILVDDCDGLDNAVLNSLMKKYKTLVMSRDVIIMIIQSYTIVNFTPFLVQPVSYEEMVKWGYPPELVKTDLENESRF